MVSSGLLRRVALVRTDVSGEPGAYFIKVTKIGELGTTQAATSNRRTLRRNTKTSVLTRATRRNNPEDTILHGKAVVYKFTVRKQQYSLQLIRREWDGAAANHSAAIIAVL
jgi:hypothetical protein